MGGDTGLRRGGDLRASQFAGRSSCGGISPDVAWMYLHYVDEAVMPTLRDGA